MLVSWDNMAYVIDSIKNTSIHKLFEIVLKEGISFSLKKNHYLASYIQWKLEKVLPIISVGHPGCQAQTIRVLKRSLE